MRWGCVPRYWVGPFNTVHRKQTMTSLVNSEAPLAQKRLAERRAIHGYDRTSGWVGMDRGWSGLVTKASCGFEGVRRVELRTARHGVEQRWGKLHLNGDLLVSDIRQRTPKPNLTL